MSTLESLIEALALLPAGFVIGVNARQYLEAKKWLNSHKIDASFYEDKIKNRKKDSSLESMRYYLGYFGRRLAYKIHSKADNN